MTDYFYVRDVLLLRAERVNKGDNKHSKHDLLLSIPSIV